MFYLLASVFCVFIWNLSAYGETLQKGFAQPESILYDSARDIYWVSNINGDPSSKDNNGYISQIDPSGKILDLYFLKGGTQDIELNAPKGLAISGHILWVTDIDVVRRFDLRSRKPYGKPIAIPKATFLNDLVSLPSGGVFVTDSGLNPDFSNSQTDAIYFIQSTGKVLKVAQDPQLNNPNGLALSNGQLLVVGFHQKGALYTLNSQGGKEVLLNLPAGDLDGIVTLKKGSLLISSWKLGGVYLVKPDKKLEIVVDGLTSPADIGYDSKRNLVLIPLLNKNQIQIVPLPKQ